MLYHKIPIYTLLSMIYLLVGCSTYELVGVKDQIYLKDLQEGLKYKLRREDPVYASVIGYDDPITLDKLYDNDHIIGLLPNGKAVEFVIDDIQELWHQKLPVRTCKYWTGTFNLTLYEKPCPLSE